MTTQRHRRNKQQQASDILAKLLHTQEDEAAILKAEYQRAEVVAGQTRRALELLDTGPVKDFQLPSPVLATGEGGLGIFWIHCWWLD